MIKICKRWINYFFEYDTAQEQMNYLKGRGFDVEELPSPMRQYLSGKQGFGPHSYDTWEEGEALTEMCKRINPDTPYRFRLLNPGFNLDQLKSLEGCKFLVGAGGIWIPQSLQNNLFQFMYRHHPNLHYDFFIHPKNKDYIRSQIINPSMPKGFLVTLENVYDYEADFTIDLNF